MNRSLIFTLDSADYCKLCKNNHRLIQVGFVRLTIHIPEGLSCTGDLMFIPGDKGTTWMGCQPIVGNNHLHKHYEKFRELSTYLWTGGGNRSTQRKPLKERVIPGGKHVNHQATVTPFSWHNI